MTILLLICKQNMPMGFFKWTRLHSWETNKCCFFMEQGYLIIDLLCDWQAVILLWCVFKYFKWSESALLIDKFIIKIQYLERIQTSLTLPFIKNFAPVFNRFIHVRVRDFFFIQIVCLLFRVSIYRHFII